MSKKSGLFYRMIAGIKSMFAPYDYRGLPATTEPEKQVAKNHPKGKRHRTFGKEITSFGTKPAYYKDKVLYKDQGDIIWTPTGSYWATRALAEANK